MGGFTNKDEHVHQTDYEGDMFTGITTYHGLVRIYNSKQWPGRLFWIIIVCLAYSLFVVQAYNLLVAYRAKPTNYKSNIRTPENGIQFPSVTVCNYSPVKRSKVRGGEYGNMSSDVLTYVMSSFLAVEKIYSFQKFYDQIVRYNQQFNQYNQTLSSSFRFEAFFNHSAFDCEDLFVSCTFGGFNFSCCDFAERIMTDVGLCYKFRRFGPFGWMQRQYVSGASYGLQLVMNVQTDQYPVGSLFEMERGIRFFAHRDEEAPHMSAKSVAIPSGFKGDGALAITNWNLLDTKDWGECQSEWLPQDDPIYYTKYTLANCEANCMANYYRHHCGCVPMKYFPHDPPSQDLQSTERISSRTTKNGSKYWYQCSGRKCGIECDKLEYQIFMSYANIQPNLLSHLNLHIDNLTYAKENYVLLTTYLKDISYTEHIQQRALDATTILSNIGGNTGMFLGMSVITLAEIFVFFSKLCWAQISSKRHGKIQQKLDEEKVEAGAAARQVTLPIDDDGGDREIRNLEKEASNKFERSHSSTVLQSHFEYHQYGEK